MQIKPLKKMTTNIADYLQSQLIPFYCRSICLLIYICALTYIFYNACLCSSHFFVNIEGELLEGFGIYLLSFLD